MKIHTWASTDETLPPSERACARIAIPAMTGFGQSRRKGEEWHPVILYAATEAEAHTKAQNWWDAELAKEQDKLDRAAERAAKRAKPKGVAQTETPESEEEADFVL